MKAPPIEFARRITARHGAAGTKWLTRLPSIVSDCAERWSLAVEPPFEPMSHAWVAPAVRADGAHVVLKIGFPNSQLLAEIDSLRLFAGRGVVRLLDFEREQGIQLIERLRPGAPLSSLDDDQGATSVAARIMRQMWRPAPREHSFPTVADLASGISALRRRFEGGSGPFPTRLVDAAETLFTDLIASSDDPSLLHGDLHHGNILSAERQPWLAIDPKGLVGEPAYEVGALLRNPLPQLLEGPRPQRVLARRADRLAEELGFDRERVVGWGLAQAVLAAWWSFEDHGRGWEQWIACAELLSPLLTPVT